MVGEHVYSLVSQKGGTVVFGNGAQVLPRDLAVGLELVDLARDLLPVGLGAAAEAAKVRVQVGRVRALLQYDRAQMVQQRVLVHRVFDLGHARQVVELEAFGLSTIKYKYINQMFDFEKSINGNKYAHRMS